MSIFARELKINLKSFIIWTAVMLLLFVTVIAIYPSMFSDKAEEIDKMMKLFPPELLSAFNMDIVSISSASGWIKSEGAVFFLLVGTLYSALLGGGILVKEQSDKTAEFLFTRPIKRSTAVTSKLLSGLLYVVLIDLLTAVNIFVGLKLQDDLNLKEMSLVLLSPIIVNILCFVFMMFVSVFFAKSRKTVGISFAFVFGSYFLYLIGTLSEKIEWLKYFSFFTVCDTRKIVESGSLSAIAVIIAVAVIAVCIAMTYVFYNKKEFTA